MIDLNNLTLGGLKPPSTGSLVGMAADTISSFLPQKTEYSGDKGHITQTMDGIYDTASDIAMSIPILGAGMKGAKVLSLGINALGGGTDGMTNTDAILGSSLGQTLLAPISLVNGFGGKKADTVTRDTKAFSQVGSSYGGVNAGMNEATRLSGKKYGLFSSSARKKANNLINEMGRQQAVMSDIGLNTEMNNELLANQSALAGQSSAFELSGGYNMTTARAAKYGMKFSINDILKAKNIISGNINITKMAEGGEVKDINLEKKLIRNPKVNRAIRIAKEGIKIEEFQWNWDLTPVTDEEIQNLIGILYAKEGAKLGELPNFLPEGELHARKHNLEDLNPELEGNITKKGIPVISEEKGGELVQQAEIERDELIISKELTDKMEELCKKYYDYEYSQKEKDEVAIEAGKILANEIINNTIGKTELLK